MRPILLLLILTHLSLFSQTDYPEWERLDYEGFTPSEIMKIEVNSKNELIGLLPTGVFRSTDLGNNWEKLNTPDSLIYDLHRALIVNKNIIIAYAYKSNTLNNNVYLDAMKYIIISYDYGNNWEVIPANSFFPNTLVTCSDNQGNFWGRGGRYVKDSNNKEIYLASVVKFDFNNKQFNRVFERNLDNIYIICSDSILIAYSLFDTVFNKGLTTEKILSILYVFVSEDYGETWNTINPDGGDIPYYMFEKFQIMLYKPFFYKGSLYFIKNNSSDENDNRYLAIDIKNKKYNYEKLHDFYRRGNFTKYNDSLILFTGGIKSTDGWSIWRTIDDMQTWEKINFNTSMWYPYLTIDSNANIYAKEDYGIWRLMKGSIGWTLQNKGLYSLGGALIKINSKSDIFTYPFTNEGFKYYQYKTMQWQNLNTDSCSIDMGPEKFFEFMYNDELYIKTSCGLKKWDIINGDKKDIIIDDSLKLEKINYYNGTNFVLGATEYNPKNKQNPYFFTFSYNRGKIWNVNYNFNDPKKGKTWIGFFNVNNDWIRIIDSCRIYLSKDRGTTWLQVLNDTANPKLYDSWMEETYDKPLYCNINTYSGVGYVIYGSDYYVEKILYLTTDNGYTWTDISDIDSIKSMLFFIGQWQGSNYTQNYYLIPDHSTGYFYAATPCGVYRSTDSLKSFQCISEGKIEPSEIKDVVLGNDGRLYAVNIRGIWRTKTKVINSVEKDGDIVNNDVKIIISPNPATEYITINMERCATLLKCGTSTIEIYDVMGVLVARTSSSVLNGQTGTSDPPRIDISNLSPGVYFLKIGDRVEKFIKY